MDTQEEKIYIATLIAVIAFIILVVFFVANIIKHQRAKVAIQNRKVIDEINSIDKERERIAIDLHDGVGAPISAIKLQLECIGGLDEAGKDIIKKSEKLIDDVAKSLKSISYNMVPMVLQRRGLDAAIQEFLMSIVVPGGMKIDYDYRLTEPAPDKVVHIYRLTQEILNNVMKHSKATQLLIHFSEFKNKIILRIKDDGKGFSSDLYHTGGTGLGLRNISSRAALLNAEVLLESRPGHGTDYQIEIPL